jgi:hypothetical protein
MHHNLPKGNYQIGRRRRDSQPWACATMSGDPSMLQDQIKDHHHHTPLKITFSEVFLTQKFIFIYAVVCCVPLLTTIFSALRFAFLLPSLLPLLLLHLLALAAALCAAATLNSYSCSYGADRVWFVSGNVASSLSILKTKANRSTYMALSMN